jgi:predicted AlkP superfamily phosphohydrolase/phosphomutase
MDPDLAREFMREGRMPNLTALAKRGGFYRLETLATPHCDAVWSTVAAGRTAEKPIVTFEPARLLFNLVPLAEERWITTRTAPSFWASASDAGIRASVISVPGSFPPERMSNGELLAGTPLPDLHGSQGTYQFFATSLPDTADTNTKAAGLVRKLRFEQRVARSSFVGAFHPVSRDELSIPLEITWNHEARSANIIVGPHAVHLREREWSRWLELDFPINAITRVRGFTQLYLIRAGTELELYASPVQWHPNRPPAPISSPPGFARELYDRLGLFRTAGWNAATSALVDERIDEAAFLDDIDRAYQDRAETILNRFDVGEWDLLVGVLDTPDRVQHVMWRLIDTQHPRYDSEIARRYGSSIEQSYQQADELLGEIMARLRDDPDTLLMVVSDHGFHTVRSQSKWSGDHTDTEVSELAGMLVTNHPLPTATPRLIDIAPTVLRHLGVPAPAHLQGKPLL